MSTREVFHWKGLRGLGNPSLLKLPKTVLLNSSQGKQPKGNESWVEATRRAADAVDAQQAILTSIGLNTWELVTYLAARNQTPQVCLLLAHNPEEFERDAHEVATDFTLNWEQVCFLHLPLNKRSPKKSWKERDRLAVSMADTVYPISIKPRGQMADSLRNLTGGSIVCEDFATEWTPSSPRKPYRLDRQRIEEEVDPETKGWLFHWTRAADGPWPGERKGDYYRDVLISGSEYARSAERTLNRIVEEKRIRGSNWRIRGQSKVVCFSARAPSRSAHLFSWRRRYARFTAEPYGIALHPGVAKEMGVTRVVYLPDGETPPRIPPYLQQAEGQVGFWPEEKEFRHEGDLSLADLPRGSWEPLILPFAP